MFTPALRYAAIFFGVLFLGEFVLVPSLYFGWIGVLKLGVVLALVILADIVADTTTYFLGRSVPQRYLFRLPGFRSRSYLIDGMSRLLRTHGLRILFVSRFVVGTRVLIQGLYGMHKLPYWRYILVSITGSFLWVLLVLAIVAAVDASISGLRSLTGHIQIAIAVAVLIILGGSVGFHHFKKRALSDKNETAGKKTDNDVE